MADAVGEEYRSSLSDLNFNSKPHINMLTIIAEENLIHSKIIVSTIINHINSVSSDLKLPSLYLVDSIMKNVGRDYIDHFSKQMIELFCGVFEKVDEATRSALYKLRQTWNEILPKSILYGLDHRVNIIDPAWPITARVATTSIHVNPKFVGGPANKAVQELVKESEIKKKKDEMNKMLDKRTEEETVKKLIEAKKAELKKLQEAKRETLLHVKQKVLNNVMLKQKSQHAIHRDPRLKKVAALLASESENSLEKTNNSLQSVVVVTSTESNNVTPPNLSSKINASLSSETKSNCAPQTAQISKDVIVSNKKRTIDPIEPVLDVGPHKKACKDSIVVDSLKTQILNNDLQKQVNPIIKDEKIDSKSSNHTFPEPMDISGNNSPTSVNFKENQPVPAPLVANPRLPNPSLFLGKEDKDYRIISRLPDIPKLREEISLHPPFKKEQFPVSVDNSRINQPSLVSQFGFKPLHSVDPIGQNKPTSTDIKSVARTLSPIPSTQTFKLDGKDRVIHFIDKRAFAFMDDKKPHELSFIGPQRNVFVEGLHQPLTLGFDGKAVEFDIDGKKNTIQFGTPAREVYVNNCPYEAQFGGPSFIAIIGGNKPHHITVDGPSPQVLISEKPAYDLYEAFNKDKEITSQVSVPETKVLSTNVGFPSQDVDMRVKVNPLKPPPFFETTEKLKDIDWRHVPTTENQPTWNLPKSVEPVNNISNNGNAVNSAINTLSFAAERFPAPSSFVSTTASFPHVNNSSIPTGQARNGLQNISEQNAPWPEQNSGNTRPPSENPLHLGQPSQPIRPLLPPPSLPPSLSTLPPPPPLPNLPPVDVRPMTWKPLPPPPMFSSSIPNIERQKIPLLPTPNIMPLNTAVIMNPPQEPQPPPPLPVIPPIDVGSIYEKLVAAGIITKTTAPEEPAAIDNPVEVIEKTEEKAEPPKEEKEIPEIEFNSKSLKQFYPGVLVGLYKGSQCATCGMRFKNSQGEQYGRHLDWHFRMNRREKDGAKKAFSRRLFYVLKDWIQFTEIEEATERAPSYFELQADGVTLKTEEVEKIHSVRASECETEKCDVCGEHFQLFWVEEEEEWHLRHAVRHDGEVYHPACYEDFKKASEAPMVEEIKEEDISIDSSKEEMDISIDLSKEEIEMEVPKNSSSDVESSKTDVTKDDLSKDNTNINVSLKVDPSKEQHSDAILSGAKFLETCLTEAKSPTNLPTDLVSMPNVSDMKISTPNSPEKMEVDELKDIKVPIKLEPVEVKQDIVPSVTDQSAIQLDNEISIKEEPVDDSEFSATEEDTGLSQIIVYMSDELLPEDELTDVNTENDSKSNTDCKPVNEISNMTAICTEIKEGAESDEEEFRPPTPDPSFEVQDPVFKGTELSALCTIM